MNDYVKNRITEKAEEKKKLFNKNNVEALLSAVFAFLGSVFAAIIATGYTFSIDTFRDPKFYLSTAVSFGVMMYTFNFVKRVAVAAKKRNKEGEYFKSKEREERITKYVRDNHLEGEIEKMVAFENELRRKNAAQRLLDKVTYGLNIDDIEDLEQEDNPAINVSEFNVFVIKRGLKKRGVKKLKKAINNVLNGRYAYERLTAHELLVDISLDHKHAKQMRVNETKLDRAENKRKAIMFISSTAVSNALLWSGLSPRFWTCLLGQVTLILTSIISAYTVAAKRVDTLTLVSQNKCDFLNDVYNKKPLSDNA